MIGSTITSKQERVMSVIGRRLQVAAGNPPLGMQLGSLMGIEGLQASSKNRKSEEHTILFFLINLFLIEG